LDTYVDHLVAVELAMLGADRGLIVGAGQDGPEADADREGEQTECEREHGSLRS
jgi:hypothetical protein